MHLQAENIHLEEHRISTAVIKMLRKCSEFNSYTDSVSNEESKINRMI